MDRTLANSLKNGEFLLGDYSSQDFNSLIEYRPVIQKPRRKVTPKSVNGRSGDLLFDEEAYENTPLDLELYFKAETEEERNHLRDLITFAFDTGTYLPFVPYFDKDKIYQVQTTQAPIFSGNIAFGYKEKYTVTFTVKPFKKLIESDKLTMSSGQTVTNPSRYLSKPVFTITGSGDMTLNVNGVAFIIKKIQDSIIVNSEIPSAYRNISGEIYNEENKIYTRDYPVLKSGNNVISWTGSGITKVEVETRWRTL